MTSIRAFICFSSNPNMIFSITFRTLYLLEPLGNIFPPPSPASELSDKINCFSYERKTDVLTYILCHSLDLYIQFYLNCLMTLIIFKQN